MESGNATLIKELTEMGYYHLRDVPGRGICGIGLMMFTTGLFYGMDEFGYDGRYCYRTPAEAVEALREWDGKGYPAGDWIKHKGANVDEYNPRNSKEII
jgi:hypothetical protein